MTGCWGSTSGHDLTNAFGRSWNLTGSDRTLGSCAWSWHYAASDHHLTIGIGHSVFEERDDVAAIHRPNAGRVRLVDMTGASGRHAVSLFFEPTALFDGGFYLKPLGRLKPQLLHIFIDIATL